MITGGELVGPPELQISGAAGIEHAQKGEITFVSKASMLKRAETCLADAVLIPKTLPVLNKPMIRVDNVRLAFAKNF